jgi:YHS domain-containing protein
MKNTAWFLTLGFVAASGWARAALPVDRLNANGVALCVDRESKTDENCYDPASYFVGQSSQAAKPQAAGAEGSRKFRFKYKAATYVFSSAEHLELFKKAPEKYAPQFGGWCAYAVAAKKDKVDIDPTKFVIQDGRLLVFFDRFYAHTRTLWLSDPKTTPSAYLHEADENWPQVQKQ